MVRMRVTTRARVMMSISRGERMRRTMQVVDATGVIYIETVIEGRLDHLNRNVVINAKFS